MSSLTGKLKHWAIRTCPPGVFAKLRHLTSTMRYGRKDRASVFTEIYQRNSWGNEESRSGNGSTLERTEPIRAMIPRILGKHGVIRMLDAGCGDFNWMREVDLGAVDYHGVDLVDEMIRQNQARYGSDTRHFSTADIVADTLPAADLIFCRDCLFHLSNSDAMKALENFRRTGARWLLTTTDPTQERNLLIATGSYRPINLCAEPFNFPPPLESVPDRNRQIGLWDLTQLGK